LKPIFVDTHTHLYASEFDEDRNIAIEAAIEAGVNHFFVPSIDSQSIQKMYDLEGNYPENVSLMAGLHPCYVKGNYEDELRIVETQLESRPFAAVGEIGIDLYWDKTTLEIQKIAFQHQIQLAKKYKLPINIHCRSAFNEIFSILTKEKSEDLKGIFHCFSGSYEEAQKAISMNMKLGIGGVSTFKNAKLDQFMNKISLEHIVLETDSPYLAPEPFRGKRNESKYIPIIANKLAEIYGVSIENIAAITTKNALELYQNYKISPFNRDI
jgi:TatD DNase family protein